MKVTKATLWGVSRRLILAWFFLSVSVLLQGDRLIRPVLPFASAVIEIIQSDYRATLKISNSQPGLIQMQAITRRVIPSIAGSGAKLTAGVHVSHALVPLVLFFCFLLAWPVEKYQERLTLLVMGIPLSFSLVALTLPFQLAGSLENMFQGYAQQYAVNREKPLLLTWMLFLEVGGRWLLPLVLAIASCVWVQSLRSKQKKPHHSKTSRFKKNNE